MVPHRLQTQGIAAMTDETAKPISTRKVQTQQFQPHGQVEGWMEGDLLLYIANGPFNKELVDCLAITQSEFLQSMQPSGPWASICTILDSAIGGPDTLARYAQMMCAPKPAGLAPIATAFVMAPDVEGARLMAPHFAKIYADIPRHFQIFETMAQARAWAQAMIAENTPR